MVGGEVLGFWQEGGRLRGARVFGGVAGDSGTWAGGYRALLIVGVGVDFVAVVASRVSARQPTPFLCLAKERGAKKSDPTVRVPCVPVGTQGQPPVLASGGEALELGPAGLRQSRFLLVFA